MEAQKGLASRPDRIRGGTARACARIPTFQVSTLQPEVRVTTFRTYLEGSLRYLGGEGQWSYLLHRITGLGTLLFLAVHILATSTVYFFPSLYEHAIAL